VLVTADLDEPVNPTLRLAARLAEADGGTVRPLVVITPAGENPTREQLEHAEQAIGALGLEAHIEVRHDDSELAGMAHTARSLGSSLVLVNATGASWLPATNSPSADLLESCTSPVAFVRPDAVTADRVVLLLSTHHAARPGPAARLAVDLAVRLASSGLETVVVAGGTVATELLSPLAGHPVARSDWASWLDGGVRPEDLVVVPRGRNGAAADRAARRAEAVGA